eukprot:TRINITY_DN52351_c0_g1_i1.p1 TRINITY_DN52351_c0_g1~~TRINITY_DN52351_c0_g1_i1.p1  ORF type:complete len:145 (+),score=18.14 TRINITY_DN52351_c0_g1_i1:54-437(+)
MDSADDTQQTKSAVSGFMDFRKLSIHDIVHWNNKIASGLVCAVFLVIFLLLTYFNYSITTLLCRSFFILIILVKVYSLLMQQQPPKKDDFNAMLDPLFAEMKTYTNRWAVTLYGVYTWEDTMRTVKV